MYSPTKSQPYSVIHNSSLYTHYMHALFEKKEMEKCMVRSPPSDGLGQKVLHDYHDHAQVCPPELSTQRSGVEALFPIKLHVMLSRVEDSGLSTSFPGEIISILFSMSLLELIQDTHC